MNTLFKHGILIATLACAGLAAAAEPHRPALASVEEAIESHSAAIVLPSGPGSALVVTPCGGCTPVLARATPTTLYFLRKQSVSLAEFVAALAGKDIAVTILRSTHGGTLTRVIADLAVPQPAAKTR